jgi:hypothetical protein
MADSERVKFERDFNYTWPESRAMTRYRNNWEGRVKAEVAEAAVAAGAARRVAKASTSTEPPVGPKGGKLDKGKPEPRLPGNLDPALAEPPALTPNLSNPEESE